MVRKGCNSLVRAEKILTHIAWVGMASYMELLNKFQYPKSSLLNLLNVMVECGFLIKNKNSLSAQDYKSSAGGCRQLHGQTSFEESRRQQEMSAKTRLRGRIQIVMKRISLIYLDNV